MKHLITAYRGVIRALHERPEMLQLPQKAEKPSRHDSFTHF